MSNNSHKKTFLVRSCTPKRSYPLWRYQFWKRIFNCKKNFHLKKFLISWVSEFLINLKSYIFCLHFIQYLHVWIRIHIRNTGSDDRIRIQEAPENRSNTDPHPQHCLNINKDWMNFKENTLAPMFRIIFM